MSAATPAPPKQAAAVPPAPVAPAKTAPPVVREMPRETAKEVNKPQDVPFSGPSFLGLSSASSESSGEYLLEEEAQSSGRGKMLIALLLLLVAAGLLGWKWHFGNFPWQSASNAPVTTTTQNASAPAANAPAATGAPASPTDSTNTQNQAAAPQNAAPTATQPADNSAAPATDSAANGDTAANKTAQPAASDAGQSSSDQASTEQDGSPPKAADQTAANAAAKPAPVKPAVAAPKAAPRRTVATDDDSPESEAAALLTQGERYLNGNGVPQNCGRAQDSLRSAADRGNFQAVSDLATMYSTGHCVKKDLPTAYRWFVKALHQQPNNGRISTDLQVLWNQMTPEEKQVAMQK